MGHVFVCFLFVRAPLTKSSSRNSLVGVAAPCAHRGQQCNLLSYTNNIALTKQNIGYIAFIFASLAEAFVLSNHLHGRPNELERSIHRFWWMCAVGKGAAGAIELYCPTALLAALSRHFFMLLQGVWMATIAFVWMHDPEDRWPSWWQPTDSPQLGMLVAAMFVWAAIGCAFVILSLVYFAYDKGTRRVRVAL